MNFVDFIKKIELGDSIILVIYMGSHISILREVADANQVVKKQVNHVF